MIVPTRRIESRSRSIRSDLLIETIAATARLPGARRFHWHVCDLVGRLARGRGFQCVIEIGPDAWMKIFLDDPYWSRLIATSYDYEPELRHALARLRDVDFDVLDCGANFGYWSILLSTHRRVVAVEASPSTFEILTDNCHRNGTRFTCVHRAVASEADRVVTIDGSNGHAAARALATTGHEGVRTTTLDALAAGLGERVLVKLDVEGDEIDALRGAKDLLAHRDVLLCYEDHGNDPASRTTAFVLDELGLRVRFCDDDGDWHAITSPDAASRVKRRRTRGYNFFACKASSAFLPHLR